MTEIRCASISAYNNKRCRMTGHPNVSDVVFLCCHHRPSDTFTPDIAQDAAALLEQRRHDRALTEAARAEADARYRELVQRPGVNRADGHVHGRARVSIAVVDGDRSAW